MPAFQVFSREAGERVAEGMSRELGR